MISSLFYATIPPYNNQAFSPHYKPLKTDPVKFSRATNEIDGVPLPSGWEVDDARLGSAMVTHPRHAYYVKVQKLIVDFDKMWSTDFSPFKEPNKEACLIFHPFDSANNYFVPHYKNDGSLEKITWIYKQGPNNRYTHVCIRQTPRLKEHGSINFNDASTLYDGNQRSGTQLDLMPGDYIASYQNGRIQTIFQVIQPDKPGTPFLKLFISQNWLNRPKSDGTVPRFLRWRPDLEPPQFEPF